VLKRFIHSMRGPARRLLLLVLVVKFATAAAEVISTTALALGGVAFVILFLAVGLLPLLAGYGFRKRATL